MFIRFPFDTFDRRSCQSRGFDIFIGVGLSALLVSTNWAMREPLEREASDRLAPTLLFACNILKLKSSAEGAKAEYFIVIWQRMTNNGVLQPLAY